MNHQCQFKKGIFILRPCGREAKLQCRKCQKAICRKCLSKAEPDLCIACGMSTSSDWRDDGYSYGHRDRWHRDHGYHPSHHSGGVAGAAVGAAASAHDQPPFDQQDTREFDSKEPHESGNWGDEGDISAFDS